MRHARRVLPLITALAGLTACAIPPETAATAAAPASPTAPAAPAILVGATPTLLAAELGQPTLRHTEGTSEVWLYRSDTCGLNLFLFPDDSGTPRVATAVSDTGTAAQCAAAIARLPARVARLERASST